jgi:FkbM family methyltransferase
MYKESTKVISYAQNAEDIVLLRALSHFPHGFYVDIGAWHPVIDSVTKVFYDRGWFGINVEPQSSLFEAFVEQRPKDTNLQLAVSDRPGNLPLWVPRYSALATCKSSMLDMSIPDYSDPVEYVVEAKRLDSLLREYAGAREIHFLKIDVEGYEANVISSADFDKCRPLVLIIEATSPHTNEPTWYDWEPRLLSRGYVFALFDGLNRFYVREESRELLPKLAVPANCLDGFITYREMMMRHELEDAQSKSKLKSLSISSHC